MRSKRKSGSGLRLLHTSIFTVVCVLGIFVVYPAFKELLSAGNADKRR